MIRVSAPHPAIALFAALLAAFAWSVAPSDGRAADSPEEAGLKIATEARERQKGFGNFTASLTMNGCGSKRGQESKREVRLKVIEVEEDGDRSMFVFDRPRDVRGTAFLVHAHKNDPDDQWLYLPALKRVKRISSSNQSGSFMGSEFSYEDMGTVEIEKFTHRFLRDEACGDLECVVSGAAVPNKPGFRLFPVSWSGWIGRSSAPCKSSSSTAGTRISRRWS